MARRRASGRAATLARMPSYPVESDTPEPRPAIGVDLGGTKTEAIVLAPDGRALWRERVATPGGDYRATLAAVAR